MKLSTLKIIFINIFLCLVISIVIYAADLFLKLPFQEGESFVITQGYNTSFTHNGKDKYALDFTQNGCDAYGKPVLAVANGRLKWALPESKSGGYGNAVKIDHGNGIESIYGHLEYFVDFQENQEITQGQIIGYIGNTGFKKGIACKEHPGTHLHFAMYQNGQAYKPEPMSGYTNFIAGNWYTSDNKLVENNQAEPIAQKPPSFSPPPPGLAGGSDTLSFWDKVAFYWNGFVANLKQLFGGTTGEVQVAKPLTNTEIQQQVNQNNNSSPVPSNQEATTNNPQQSTENNSPSAQSEVWNQRFISYELTEQDKEQGIYQLVLKFQNTGNTTWTPNNVSLNIVGGYQSTAAKFYHPSWTTKLRPTKLITTIEPGGNAFFTFLLQFPKEPGAYYPQFQPVYYDGTNFHWIGSDKAIFLAEIKQSSQDTFAFAGASLEEIINSNQETQNPETTPPPISYYYPPEPTNPPSLAEEIPPKEEKDLLPLTPKLISPEDGVKIDDLGEIVFQWENLGLATYIFEIDDEEDFSSPNLAKELTQPQYTLTLEEIKTLNSGKLFWRVKAKSGNQGNDWSEISSFIIPHIIFVSEGNSIQSAVDAANPGDIIIVDDGIYKENININKNNLILKSKNGSEKTIVEAADSHDHIFEITANNIEISGFTIRNAIGIWNAGIYTSNGNIKINNNIFQNNYISIWSVGTGMQQEKLFIEDNKFSETPSSSSYGGIYLQRGGANNATITINTIKNNTFNSVYNIVVGRSTSIITNNIFTSSSLELGGTSIQLENCNFKNGGVLINQGAYNNIDLAVKNTYINDNPLLYLKGASNYNIENNYGQIILVGCNNITVQNFNISNTIAAVQLINSTNNTILNNTFNKNNYGIYAIQSSYNKITNNNISDSTESGIYLQNGSFNKVLGNNISNNNGYADGIYLNGSNNIISNNTIKDNNYGIKLWTASNNTVKENQILNNGIGIDLYYAKNNVIYNNIFSNNTKNINMWGENSGNIWQAPE